MQCNIWLSAVMPIHAKLQREQYYWLDDTCYGLCCSSILNHESACHCPTLVLDCLHC